MTEGAATGSLERKTEWKTEEPRKRSWKEERKEGWKGPIGSLFGSRKARGNPTGAVLGSTLTETSRKRVWRPRQRTSGDLRGNGQETPDATARKVTGRNPNWNGKHQEARRERCRKIEWRLPKPPRRKPTGRRQEGDRKTPGRRMPGSRQEEPRKPQEGRRKECVSTRGQILF